MDTLIILSGQYLIYFVALIAIGVALFSPRTTRNRLVFTAVFSFLIGFGLTYLAGLAYYDTRPFVQDYTVPLIPHIPDNGFPSDHTLYGIIAASTIFIFRRELGVLLEILAVTIGSARVLAGIHHPVDIVGGIILGLIAVFLGWLLMRAIMHIRVFSAALGNKYPNSPPS